MDIRKLLIFLLLVGCPLIPNIAMAQDTLDTMILSLVNKHRSKLKLQPLRSNSIIKAAAEKHSRDMANNIVPFGHDGYNDRIYGLPDSVRGFASGENVAYGPSSAEGVVRMWLKSKGHRENIEGDFTLTGIGVAQDSTGCPYYTQIFIRR